jgi:hypothetical protein
MCNKQRMCPHLPSPSVSSSPDPLLHRAATATLLYLFPPFLVRMCCSSRRALNAAWRRNKGGDSSSPYRSSQVETSPSSGGECVRSGQLWLPILNPLSHPLVGSFPPCAPSLRTCLLFSPPFLPRSRILPPPRTEASSPYGAHHARFGANRTPK